MSAKPANPLARPAPHWRRAARRLVEAMEKYGLFGSRKRSDVLALFRDPPLGGLAVWSDRTRRAYGEVVEPPAPTRAERERERRIQEAFQAKLDRARSQWGVRG